MNQRVQHSSQATTAQMSAVLERPNLPQKARLAGTHLLRRLSNPVRVSLFGGAGVGKSTLINVLAGKTILEPGHVTCPIALSYGELEKTIATTAEGKRIELDGVDIAGAAAHVPAKIQIELPLGSLQDISLLETAISPDDPELAVQMDWAIKRTDICLWCSPGFTAADNAMWQHVPDALKDHAYLVLTKVDQLAAPGALKQHLTALAPVINAEFHSVLPVAGRAALAALEARAQEIDVARWTGSGADALTKAIRQHAARGRREDLDNAQLFLARYGVETPVPQAARTPDTFVPQADPGPADRPMMPTDAPAAPPRPAAAPELWLAAAQSLSASAETLAQAATIEDAAERSTTVLETCGDVVLQLTDFVEENSDAMGEEVVDALFEASEMITLLQLEGGEEPSLDAIGVLAQLKGEFELQAAA